MRLQLSLTAGVALLCALEAREPGGLTPDLFKLYLAGCTDAAESSNTEPDKTVATMSSIIAKRPRFAPAWAQLLAAQDNFVAMAEIDGMDAALGPRKTLKRYLAEARKIHPDLPEINLVEISQLPPSDYAGKLEGITQAKARAPDRAAVWGMETHLLQSVGRMAAAVRSARRAAELEPLSPAAANQVITTLAYAGEIEEARKELSRAERKWSGTGALRDVQWAFHLRYGDPRIARSLRGQPADLYLRARLDPTPENIDMVTADIARLSETDIEQVGYAIQALAEFDKTDEVYGWLYRVPASRLALYSYLLFRPAFEDVRRDARFMIVTKRIGLLSYWRKTGIWPDFCYDPQLPYECQKEAGKLAA